MTTAIQTSTATASSAPKKLGALSVVGYGAGDAANNLAFTTATMFLLVYYTDVAGISAAAAGTLLLVVRVFDAFADIFAGRIVDRTYSKRFGKFRPFILFGSLPLLLLSVATFSIPQIGESGMLLYAYLTYAALGLAYSLVNIPYGSLAGAMTRNAGERAKLASARTVGAVLVGAGLGIFVAPLITPDRDLQSLFTFMTLGFVVVGFALYMFTFFTAKETVIRDVPKVTMKQSFAILKSNRPLLHAVRELVRVPDRHARAEHRAALLPARRPARAAAVRGPVARPDRRGLRARGLRADHRAPLRKAQRLHRRRRRHDRRRAHGLPRARRAPRRWHSPAWCCARSASPW